MVIAVRIVAVVVALFRMSGLLMAAPVLDASAADFEIRVGNITPYTGPLAAFGAIGKAEAAYFDMINARGGINGRKIRFISYDDSSDPRTALEQTRKLVERDNVLLMFGSFGTPGNFAVRPYLNDNSIPQLLSRRETRNGIGQEPFPGRWVGSRLFVPRDKFSRTTSRLIFQGAQSQCFGKTINLDEICIRGWRRASAT